MDEKTSWVQEIRDVVINDRIFANFEAAAWPGLREVLGLTGPNAWRWVVVRPHDGICSLNVAVGPTTNDSFVGDVAHLFTEERGYCGKEELLRAIRDKNKEVPTIGIYVRGRVYWLTAQDIVEAWRGETGDQGPSTPPPTTEPPQPTKPPTETPAGPKQAEEEPTPLLEEEDDELWEVPQPVLAPDNSETRLIPDYSELLEEELGDELEEELKAVEAALESVEGLSDYWKQEGMAFVRSFATLLHWERPTNTASLSLVLDHMFSNELTETLLSQLGGRYAYRLNPDLTVDETAAGLAQRLPRGVSAYWDQTSEMTIKNFLELVGWTKPTVTLEDLGRFMLDDEAAEKLCDTVERELNTRREDDTIDKTDFEKYWDAVCSTRNAWLGLNPHTKKILRANIAEMLGPLEHPNTDVMAAKVKVMGWAAIEMDTKVRVLAVVRDVVSDWMEPDWDGEDEVLLDDGPKDEPGPVVDLEETQSELPVYKGHGTWVYEVWRSPGKNVKEQIQGRHSEPVWEYTQKPFLEGMETVAKTQSPIPELPAEMLPIKVPNGELDITALLAEGERRYGKLPISEGFAEALQTLYQASDGKVKGELGRMMLLLTSQIRPWCQEEEDEMP